MAAHRRRAGMTQQQLAEAVDASVYMISKIESGASGTRFAMIERLAVALEIDPAELVAADLPRSTLQQTRYGHISRLLLELEPEELEWIGGVIEAALKCRRKS
ncbi:MAG: helix-turn-helix transcriptional regulator [Oceanicaulis sp.]|nr:helix-turn-helix transcriptional regulator [Oceanicaulis sp.]